MNAYDFVHLAFLALDGKVEGRTKLQKTVYFLGQLTGKAKALGYGPHYYGPYSTEVAEATSRLVSLGFLEQTCRGCGHYDNQGFEISRYDMALTPDGKAVAQRKAGDNPTEWEAIQRGARAFREAGEENYMRLSVAAKTYFLLGEKRGRATPSDLAGLAPRFGWAVREGEIAEAVKLLQSMKLVELCESEGKAG